ncbi:hypothetical protein K491DRAFT_711799 [Lophiostoma macrostomum CBS 122681]|uniref:Uncharacterized protein n=1 Tax=Lophiostoma macrostomum CBS 122681 TaxID=1314788 RepID=A0A6A6TKA5_9PLEO|nr:hypothetical protein K491DRAFT_711799 [Lophiostoma macrostomum CBS 122681]
MSAEEEVIDPEYLRILPKYFELTQEVKEVPAVSGAFWFGSAPMRRMHLARLSGDGPAGRIGYHYQIEQEHEKRNEDYHQFLSEQCLTSKDVPKTRFFYKKELMQTLHAIGLDIRGGLSSLIRHTYRSPKKGAKTMDSFIVTDPEKACKYVNIGIKLESATPSYPNTLREAARIYSQLCDLIEDENGNTATIKDLDQQIEEIEDEALIWELKRKKFRVQTKERYHEMLIDMALEEKLSDMQSKKWKRANGI